VRRERGLTAATGADLGEGRSATPDVAAGRPVSRGNGRGRTGRLHRAPGSTSVTVGKRAKRYLARATPEFITCMMTLCRRAGDAVRRPPARMMNDRENGARWRPNNRGQQPRDRTFTTPPPEHLSPPGITSVIICPLGLGFWLAFVVRIGLSGTKLG